MSTAMKLSITKAFQVSTRSLCWRVKSEDGSFAVTSGVAIAQCFLHVLSPLISQRKANRFHSAVCNFPIFVL